MQYTLRLLNKDSHDKAWERIEEWAYPFDQGDFTEVVMVEVGDGDAYFWFEWLTYNDLLLHMAADPASRGRFFTRRTQEGLYWAAELLGADVLWVVTEIESVNDYVKRLGWEHEPSVQGWYKRITS